MRLQRFFLRAILAVIGLGFSSTLTGCVVDFGPGGTPPGLFASDVTYPNALNSNMSYRIAFEREDIELLDKVEVTASSKWFFFFFSTGDSGYGELMRKALENGGDGVMNVTVDTEYDSIFIFYAKVTTKLSGLAYRYKREKGEESPGAAPQGGADDSAAIDETAPLSRARAQSKADGE